jgi:dimethylamine monooxygenase subunit A
VDVWAAFDGQPYRPRLGLRPLDLRFWTEPPPPGELGAELARRARLLQERPTAVWAETDGSGPAAIELGERLLGHLLGDHAGRYRRGRGPETVVDGATVDTRGWPALPAAGLLTAADWCLVRPAARPVLAAAVVCSPNRWRLADKIGRDLTAVHRPVPGYAGALRPAVDRLLGPSSAPSPGPSGEGPFNVRRTARAGWRQNWSLLGDPDLFQPDAGPSAQLPVPDGIWVRSERQTLVPLPASGWWAFGIETAVRPLAAVATRPDVAARLRTAVASLDPATVAYKDLGGFRAPLLAWLERVGSVDAAQQDQ